MIKFNEAVAQRTKELLNEIGKKPYYLYKEGGIPRSTISNVLNCNINKVSGELIYQISSVLQIKLKDFYDSPLFDEISN